MKPTQIISALLFSLLFGISNAFTQNSIEELNLSQEQTKLLRAQKELIKNNRAAFKATLTKEQLALLKNRSLTKLERQEALKKTLTAPQKKLVARNRVSVKKAKNRFRKTLTKSQKQQLKKRLKTNKGKAKRRVNMRKRLQRR